MINLDYPAILDLFRDHLDPKRTESASFLMWYLENYYRLDSLEAVDAVCDQRGDKGVDGIYVNENDVSIEIFQCKLSQDKNSTIGDTLLKEFYGTISQFKNKESIENLIRTGGDAEVVRLARRLDLTNIIHQYAVHGIFIANVDIDRNGKAYLDETPEITFVGKSRLIGEYISDEREMPTASRADFDVSGFSISQYIVDKKTKVIIAPIKAKELIKLQGISDQSIFALNVRGPLGRTSVNRDIVSSIRDPKKHKLFPLFHNGITITCGTITDTSEKITISNYFVVNGCQTLDSLYKNQVALSDDLRILTRFVQMDVSSDLAKMVTEYSNNQNATKPRDFKANDPIQIRLQNEFEQFYKGQYSFEIKRGEDPRVGEIISNEVAGLYLMCFDLKEPWATHRKYKIFDEKHADLFGRPEVTADRIVMVYEIMKPIAIGAQRINNKLLGKYALTRYAMLYMLRCVLESDNLGQELLRNPIPFVRNKLDREYLMQCIGKIVNDMVIDINAEASQYGDDFDYRGKLRDEGWVKHLSQEVVSSYMKLVQRGRIESFEAEWNHRTAKRI